LATHERAAVRVDELDNELKLGGRRLLLADDTRELQTLIAVDLASIPEKSRVVIRTHEGIVVS
jgi:hypothetical protein